MKTTLLPIVSLIFATCLLCAQEPAKPLGKPDATTELKGASAPYYAAVESVSADYQKWVVALETWYLTELDKLTGARAKLGDLDGAVAIKAERERIAAHAATTPEQIQAMPVPLRTLRMTYEQGVKRIADEGTRRIDVARRKYLADLEALQKRITISGDIDQALLIKAEKERFIAEMAAGPGTAISPPPPPPVIPTPAPIPEPVKIQPVGSSTVTKFGTVRIADATKERPFVNSLGMEFVPVPGTTVLFCRWETRVKDYAEYARGKKVEASWTQQQKDGVPISREPEHPVCAVPLNNAIAFCEWLTKKEVASGKLPQQMKYRLPTDEEWSRAVGLAKEEGATPSERARKNGVNFPWGTGFPPPNAKVGNYADSAFHEKFPSAKWLDGYTDGYAGTAPVGSFPANDYGIYDMGGNLWEWCEDLIRPGDAGHVVRGGSWDYGDRGNLLSSSRRSYHAGANYILIGFRCVVSMSAR